MIKISNEVKEILKKVNEESVTDKEKLIDDINSSISMIIGPDEAYETLENIINDYINTGEISLEELIPKIDKDARYALTKAYKMSMYSDKRLIEEFRDVHYVDFDMEKYNKIKADIKANLKAQSEPKPHPDVYTYADAERDGKINIDQYGNIDCALLGLTSLEGAPKKVNRSFRCAGNQLTSLEGGPKEVGGDFSCVANKLTSLEGGPKEVGGNFGCGGNKLISLEGAPKEVKGDFDCALNKLTSLKDAPEVVGGKFDCMYNPLISLEGAPKEVKGDFDCSHTNLTSLKGGPEVVGGDFNCSCNEELISLDGAPKEIGRNFNCSFCRNLKSLIGAPKNIGKNMSNEFPYPKYICKNCGLTSLDGFIDNYNPKTSELSVYCGNNYLTKDELNKYGLYSGYSNQYHGNRKQKI